MVTSKDIAKEAGVSTMTVSNVINGNHQKVSAKNIELINELIKKYHYVPNLSARSLSSKSTKIIGVLVPLEGDYNFFKDPYLSELIGVIEYAIRKKGYFAMIRSVSTVSDISELVKNWNMDGAIFLLPHYDNILHKIISKNNLPLVSLDSYSDYKDVLNVGINDYKGGYIATKFLINKGHKKIAFAGPTKENVVKERFNGYKDALADSGIPYNDSIIYDVSPVYDLGLSIGKEISNRRGDITAVFATADIMGLGIIEGARLNGYAIPNDLSVIGFDNIEASIFSSPKLTTISQNITTKAECAIDLLTEKINNSTVKQNRYVLDVELIERQSVLQYNG
ncbi:MAG: LacI family transcriptional regulator [Clostridiales bacterium]|jgi:LacI family transcriptional regulator|nr:LacI family transcriptional regulator [Clostridiales bacterium]